MTPKDAMGNPLLKGDLVVLIHGDARIRAVVYEVEEGGLLAPTADPRNQMALPAKVTFFILPHVEICDPRNPQLINCYKVVKPPDFTTPPLPAKA